MGSPSRSPSKSDGSPTTASVIHASISLLLVRQSHFLASSSDRFRRFPGALNLTDFPDVPQEVRGRRWASGDVVDAKLEEPFILPPAERRLGNTQGDHRFFGGEVFTAGDGSSHEPNPGLRLRSLLLQLVATLFSLELPLASCPERAIDGGGRFLEPVFIEVLIVLAHVEGHFRRSISS